jgi:hypothetical protein
MDASSNPNEPNLPTPTDPIIILDEPTLPTESQPIPSNTKQFKEPTSKVWEHFTKLGRGNPEEPKATCNYCKKPYKCHSRKNGTSTLWGHVRNCKKNPKNKNNDKRQPTIAYHYKKAAVEGENDTKEIEVHQFSIKKIRLALAKMIIVDELPFRFVKHEGFNYYMNVVEPRFPIPSRVTVTKDCMKLYLNERKKLKDVLSKKGQKVCLTTDTWTFVQNLNYLCLTCHFIDSDWKYQKRILNFCLVPNHRGETIGKVVEKCLKEWGIDIVLTIIVDNASSNDVAIDYLRRKMKLKESCIVGCEFLHMRCCAHILNLIVQDGLKDIHESIAKVRNVVQYAKSSPKRFEKFLEAVKDANIQCKSLLSLDVPTRWNSSYLMREAAEKFERAFDRFINDDEQYMDYFEEPDRKWEKAQRSSPLS